MNVISEREKVQLLEGGERLAQKEGVRRPPSAPVLPMPEYLRQVEQWAELFPPPARKPACGNSWKL